MGGHNGGSKEERERSKKQRVKKVESDWKRPHGRRGQLASKCVQVLIIVTSQSYLTKTEFFFVLRP